METAELLTDGWSHDWLWGLPLIVLTVVAHGFGLIGIRDLVFVGLRGRLRAPRSVAFTVIVSVTVLLLTTLHALESGVWAAAYVLLGALPEPRSAILYSLGAMTTYGHANIFLAKDWRLMGALEALNGMMLFGLTTAFLFSALHESWSRDAPSGGTDPKPPRV